MCRRCCAVFVMLGAIVSRRAVSHSGRRAVFVTVLCWHPPSPATMSANIPQQQHPNAQLLLSATKGFDYLFSNDIVTAREHFKNHDDPFHMMGLGVCAFLEAALGMEVRDFCLFCGEWLTCVDLVGSHGRGDALPRNLGSGCAATNARDEARYVVPRALHTWTGMGDTQRRRGRSTRPHARAQAWTNLPALSTQLTVPQ